MNARQRRTARRALHRERVEVEAVIEAHGRKQCELVGLNPDRWGVETLDWWSVRKELARRADIALELRRVRLTGV